MKNYDETLSGIYCGLPSLDRSPLANARTLTLNAGSRLQANGGAARFISFEDDNKRHYHLAHRVTWITETVSRRMSIAQIRALDSKNHIVPLVVINIAARAAIH